MAKRASGPSAKKKGSAKTSASERGASNAGASPSEVVGVLADQQQAATRIQREFAEDVKQVSDKYARHCAEASVKRLDQLQAAQKEIERQLSEAYQTFAEEMTAAFEGEETSEALSQAFTDYRKAVAEWYSPVELQEKLSDSYAKLLEKLHSAYLEPNAQQIVEQAYRSYTQEISDAWATSEAAQRAKDAYAVYVKALSEAGDEVKKRSEESYSALMAKVETIYANRDLWQQYRSAENQYAHELGDAAIEYYETYAKSQTSTLRAFQGLEEKR